MPLGQFAMPVAVMKPSAGVAQLRDSISHKRLRAASLPSWRAVVTFVSSPTKATRRAACSAGQCLFRFPGKVFISFLLQVAGLRTRGPISNSRTAQHKRRHICRGL